MATKAGDRVRKPLAVLISDVHYSLSTLSLADTAMRQAVQTANDLHVTLVVAGDLHDTKANLRGECVNAMIETFKFCNTPPAVLIGNHDRLNEKAPEHSLNFLAPYAMVIDEPKYLTPVGYMVPYQHEVSSFITALCNAAPNSFIICHQGVTGSKSGDYIQDKSAIDTDYLEGRRIISGHYHTRQTIPLPHGGTWDYIGNPYTLNYAEANDPPKGFQILYTDGSLEFVPTNLRKHIVIAHDLQADESVWSSGPAYRTGDRQDLIWCKISGTKESILKFNKDQFCRDKGLPRDIRLDLIPTDGPASAPNDYSIMPDGALFDSLIDSLPDTSANRKDRLKSLWKGLK